MYARQEVLGLLPPPKRIVPEVEDQLEVADDRESVRPPEAEPHGRPMVRDHEHERSPFLGLPPELDTEI